MACFSLGLSCMGLVDFLDLCGYFLSHHVSFPCVPFATKISFDVYTSRADTPAVKSPRATASTDHSQSLRSGAAVSAPALVGAAIILRAAVATALGLGPHCSSSAPAQGLRTRRRPRLPAPPRRDPHSRPQPLPASPPPRPLSKLS